MIKLEIEVYSKQDVAKGRAQNIFVYRGLHDTYWESTWVNITEKVRMDLAELEDEICQQKK